GHILVFVHLLDDIAHAGGEAVGVVSRRAHHQAHESLWRLCVRDVVFGARLSIKTLVPHISDYADDLARRRHYIVAALTFNNDVLAERLRPGEVESGKSLVDDNDRRRVLIVAPVEEATAGKRYVERAEIIRADGAMVGG